MVNLYFKSSKQTRSKVTTRLVKKDAYLYMHMRYKYITKYLVVCHNLSPLFLRANVPVTRPIIKEIRETMALKEDNFITTIKIGAGASVIVNIYLRTVRG